MSATPVLMLGDCLERMAEIPAGSVDMVMCDLPYGLTRCAWDSVIPLAPLWDHYKRVIKPGAPIVLTACQPFTSALVMSNPRWFKYDWTWRKHRGRGHLNARFQPMRDKEDVLIFCGGRAKYNPQMTAGNAYRDKSGTKATDNYNPFARVGNDNRGTRYPRQVLDFAGVHERDALHSAEKPVELLEYLIRTYTDGGDTVLDNAAGAFSTGIACLNTGRRFIGIERDPHYFAIGSERVRQHMAAVAAPELEAAD